MVDLVGRDVPTNARLFKLVFIENLESTVRRDPEIEEEVDDRFKRGGIRAIPSYRLEDVGIVSGPGSIRAVNAADVVGLILKEEPHRLVPRVHHDLPGIFHRFGWREVGGNYDHVVRGL